MTPEFLLSTKLGLGKEVLSTEADIYALGMTMHQVLTSRWPFFPREEVEVVHAVILGELLPKPENTEKIGMAEAMWDLLGEC